MPIKRIILVILLGLSIFSCKTNEDKPNNGKDKITPPAPYVPPKDNKKDNRTLMGTKWRNTMVENGGKAIHTLYFEGASSGVLSTLYLLDGKEEETENIKFTYKEEYNQSTQVTTAYITYENHDIVDECKVEWETNSLRIKDSTNGDMIFSRKE